MGKRSKEFSANKAKLVVAGNTYEKDIKATDTQVSFDVKLKKGAADLETWIFSEEGITVPAYFVDVELLK